MHRFTSTTTKAAIAALMTFIAIFGITTNASAATGTGGFKILYASESQVAHVCTVIGVAYDGDTPIDAIVCADLDTNAYNGGAYAYTEVEGYCQIEDSTTTVRCANMDLKGEFATASGVHNSSSKECGHNNGACPTGREVFGWDDTEVNINGGSCGTSTGSESLDWALVLAGSSIELPGSDLTVSLGSGVANDGSNELLRLLLIQPLSRRPR